MVLDQEGSAAGLPQSPVDFPKAVIEESPQEGVTALGLAVQDVVAAKENQPRIRQEPVNGLGLLPGSHLVQAAG